MNTTGTYIVYYHNFPTAMQITLKTLEKKNIYVNLYT